VKILLINGNTTQAITDRCAAVARQTAGADTDIIAVNAVRGPSVIGTRAENALAHGAIIELLAEHGARCDAAVIAVSFDTAVDGAREAAPFPVVGMTEASLHAAALLGGPIGFIGPGKRVRNVYRETIERTGLAGRIAGIRALDPRDQDYVDPANLVAPTIQFAQELVEHDGAESIVVAGAALAGLTERVQAGVSVPVIDGIAAGVVMAQALVRLGRPKPTAGSYARLPKRETTGYSDAVRRFFEQD
jgi:allantoin racemase